MSGRVALVTGGGSGVGAAVCRGLAAEGARAIVVCDIDQAATRACVDALPGGVGAPLDVADAEQVGRVVRETIERFGRLDVVVHAAGMDDPVAKQTIADALEAGEPPDVTTGLDETRWRRVMAVNLDGTFHVLRAAVRAMLPQEGGAIVVIGSSSAFDSPAGYPHYSASKAAVHALAQSVAKEVIGRGIRINVVAPGPTLTGMADRTPPALRSALTGPQALRYATPEEIADIVLFLAGDRAANLVGAVLLANGGRFTT